MCRSEVNFRTTLFLTLYMFRAHRAHHQEREIVSIQPLVAVTLCWSSCRVQRVKNINKYIKIVRHVGHLPRIISIVWTAVSILPYPGIEVLGFWVSPDCVLRACICVYRKEEQGNSYTVPRWSVSWVNLFQCSSRIDWISTLGWEEQ